MRSRFLPLMRIFLTGDVPLHPTDAARLKYKWRKLHPDDRPAVLKRLEKISSARRSSMADNAAKGSFLFTALAFAVGAGFVLQNVRGIELAMSSVALSFFSVTAGIVVVMISPKLKVLRHLKDRKPSGLRLLEQTLAERTLLDDDDGAPLGWHEYLALSKACEKRDMLILVDRRALLIASFAFGGGLCTTVVAFILHVLNVW